MSNMSSSNAKRRAALSLLPSICIGIVVSQVTVFMVDLPAWARISIAVVAGLLAMGVEAGLLYPAGRGWSHLFIWWKHRKRSRSREAEERRQFRDIYSPLTVMLRKWEDERSLSWDALATLAATLEQLDIWPPAIRRGVLTQVEEELKYLRKHTVVHEGLTMARERFPNPKNGNRSAT